MKFTVPGADSPEAAELLYQTASKTYNAIETNARIRSIAFWDDELHKETTLAVGRSEPWSGQDVTMILNCGACYYAFTKYRGVSEWPIMVNKQEVRQIEKFDPQPGPQTGPTDGPK